ncbi:HNH endonuclease [Natrinema salsiterrestre]|uniref:HNH endonuclease n=1 Tax=Natrinema salsiterrestre TaxID=2950540 RepID=A0A9Q4L2L2_9EURY|nr:HNH endonuclease [Natrinema salsiterrestre]MDF9745708.1 HNH endonuclease [Natrinema salsiterrestre]
MTSRDWRADREAVFDRDAFTCRHCGTDGDDEATALRLYPVGDVPLEGEVHESALVTVCADCFATLEGPEPAESMAADDLFRLVRETTRLQGTTISAVAEFASLATSLPSTLQSALDDGTDADVDDTLAEYRRDRRDILLAVAVVDARLERLAALDDDAYDPEVRTALAAFSDAAADLQSTLREVVALSETVSAGLERCHGCFDPLEGERCPTCGLEARETADWRDEDGTLAFDRLFATVNERLQGASETTETLTDRTTELAEQLTA